MNEAAERKQLTTLWVSRSVFVGIISLIATISLSQHLGLSLFSCSDGCAVVKNSWMGLPAQLISVSGVCILWFVIAKRNELLYRNLTLAGGLLGLGSLLMLFRLNANCSTCITIDCCAMFGIGTAFKRVPLAGTFVLLSVAVFAVSLPSILREPSVGKKSFLTMRPYEAKIGAIDDAIVVFSDPTCSDCRAFHLEVSRYAKASKTPILYRWHLRQETLKSSVPAVLLIEQVSEEHPELRTDVTDAVFALTVPLTSESVAKLLLELRITLRDKFAVEDRATSVDLDLISADGDLARNLGMVDVPEVADILKTDGRLRLLRIPRRNDVLIRLREQGML